MRKCEFTLLRQICQPSGADFRVLFQTNNHSLKAVPHGMRHGLNAERWKLMAESHS
jgi:hypothetical protein